MTPSPEVPLTTPGPAGSEGPSPGLPGPAMVVTRTGGIAGFNDVVEIAADGTAQVTTRDGGTRGCTPDAAALAHLRAIDLAAVGSKPSTIADGFTYSVSVGGGTASAGDGENTAIRAAFVSAAASVVSSCLENAATSAYPEQ